MKKVILLLCVLAITACEQEQSNPCPQGKGLYEQQKYYECLDRQFTNMQRRL